MTVALNVATTPGTGPDRRPGPGRATTEAAGAADFTATLNRSPDRRATLALSGPERAGPDNAGSEHSRRATPRGTAIDGDRDGRSGDAERDRLADHRVAALSLAAGGTRLQTLVDTLGVVHADPSRKSDAARQGYARTRALLPPAAL